MKVRNGIDMVYIPRIAKYSDEGNSPFLDKCFTDEEKEYCLGLSPKLRAESFAARFAAKEAAAKALGTGICTGGIGFLSFEVSRDSSGAPVILFRDKALEEARRLGVISASLSITHEKDYAVAACTLLTNEEESI
ncbi:MAG: holo-ACP synthase [Saccharofermentans sp.]|nr:holo-ACP synthase [Saccharofermentans sp.]